MGILRAWEILRSGLSQREPQCAEERARQPLIWNPLVWTEQGHMPGTRPHLAWGPLAAGPARNLGDWQDFRMLPEVQQERLSHLRGGLAMREDIQRAITDTWQAPIEHQAPQWMGAFTQIGILIAVRALSSSLRYTLRVDFGGWGRSPRW